jgi:1-pyrroline-5-carboxylate dehydrogenase
MDAPTVTYTSTTLGTPEADRLYEKALADLRATFPIRVRSHVGGEERPGALEYADTYPGDHELVIALVEEAPFALVESAQAVARKAFATWGRMPWTERVRLMRQVADRMESHRYELAATIAWETGKTRVEAVGEADEAVELIRYYSSCFERADGFAMAMGSSTERAASVLRPWGVWGVISPFNFPLALGTGMLAGVLLGGNTAVFKPASKVAVTGARLAAIMRQVLPEGTVQLLLGSGGAIGSAMVDHPDVDGFAFTGSRDVGLSSLARFSQKRPRPFIAETGGKNPVIVCKTANLEMAAAGITRSAFSFGGQKCSATSRVYVQSSRYLDLIEVLTESVAKLQVGDPHDAATDVGPLIDAGAAMRFVKTADEAKEAGRIVCGGARISSGKLARGHYVAPAISADLPPSHQHFKEELFLPYVAVASFETLDDAIAMANDSNYGLTAGIFTERSEEAQRFIDEIEAGTIYVNRAAGATSGAWPGAQPFGGWKDSGSSGRHALGPNYAMQFMREQSRTVSDKTAVDLTR